MSQERPKDRPGPKPLNDVGLERLALRYVERFATTRGRLRDYLTRKIRERGWDGGRGGSGPDPDALAQRMADLGYVDDRAFAEMRAAAMQRRGLGGRRVAEAFRAAGIGEADAASVAPDIAGRGIAAALLFARRKRIGPYGAVEPDRALREKQLAAMVRAGHAFDLSRKIVAAEPSESVLEADFE